MNSAKKIHLPQSEAEWLETGKFRVEGVTIFGVPIKCAIAPGSKDKQLVVMVGGIPREPDRQRNLPLINKLYGYLATELQVRGISSLLYNQPATGGSGGRWEKETLQSRTNILVGLSKHFRKQLLASDIALIGSSAGAYMAVGAIEKIQEQVGNVVKLILLSPAAYPERIETVPYGSAFTEIIREPWDVATSPVFPKLEKYIRNGGKAMVCFFEVDDPPIPLYIQEYYRQLMRGLSHHNSRVSVLTIPDVAHNFRKLQKKRRENLVDNESIIATAKKFLKFLT